MDNTKRQQRVIFLLRKHLKKHPVAKQLCRKYKEEDPERFIDKIPIRFEPLDVSAKTVNGEIILNSGLLEGEFRDNMRYCIHEFSHVLQQENGKVDSSSGGDEDYLDDPNEIEAFRAQLDYMDETYDNEEIQRYLEQLLDHHDIKGKERVRKIRELV